MGDRQHARALYEQGLKVALGLDRSTEILSHAFNQFSSAAFADPTWWQPFYQCGNNVSDMNLHVAAVACYRRALEAGGMPDADRAKLYCNIGWRLHSLSHSEEARAFSQQAIDLDPTLALAHVNLSCIHGMFDDSAASVRAGEAAFALEQQDPVPEMSLAFACLFDRQLARGLKHFERRFEYKLKSYTQYPYPRWTGEPDATLFLVADQGLGDTLSFARFLPAAANRVKYVHAAVQPELMRVFQHAFVHVPNLNLIPQPAPFPPSDYWTTFVSLPFALGLTDTQIRECPDIAVPVYGLPKTWKVPDRKLHVGIAWAGSPQNDINPSRSIPAIQFFDLYRVPGIQLYSLQVGDGRNDLVNAGGSPVVRDLAPYITDVAATIALLRELDLVITVESALGHICAAAGQECWIPYSYAGRDYRLGLTGTDRLWTPRHRVFRQGELDARRKSWQAVFDDIVAALREKVK